MEITDYEFGTITVSGRPYHDDITISTKGEVRPRKKELSKGPSGGHTPLAPDEIEHYIQKDSPRVIVVGTGKYGALPVPEETKNMAEERGIELVCQKTGEAIDIYTSMDGQVLAIFHLNC